VLDPLWLTTTLDRPSPRIRAGFKTILIDGTTANHQARVTAFHEGCHAVCQVLVGSPPLWVSIEPEGRLVGKTMPRDDIVHEQALVSSLAGIFGALLTQPKTALEAAENDLKQAVLYVHLAFGLPNGVRPPLNFQRVRVVANALLRHGRLDGPLVQRLMVASWKPWFWTKHEVHVTLPEIRMEGARIIAEHHGDYLNVPGGSRVHRQWIPAGW
jgi:hypothetical protein